MKARLLSLAAAWLTLIMPVPAQLLVGYGLFPYDPLCAESCLRSLTGYTLECTMPAMDHGHMMMMASSTNPRLLRPGHGVPHHGRLVPQHEVRRIHRPRL